MTFLTLEGAVSKALEVDAAGISGLTAEQIHARWQTVVKTDQHQKIPLVDLVTMLDDMLVLQTIQTKAASAQKKMQLAVPETPDLDEQACLDAVLFMRTARDYGRQTANWAKSRHIARMDNLVATGCMTAEQRTQLLNASPIEQVETKMWQTFEGLGELPLVREIQDALDRASK